MYDVRISPGVVDGSRYSEQWFRDEPGTLSEMLTWIDKMAEEPFLIGTGRTIDLYENGVNFYRRYCDYLCPLCNQPSDDGKPHVNCADLEQAQADRGE